MRRKQYLRLLNGGNSVAFHEKNGFCCVQYVSVSVSQAVDIQTYVKFMNVLGEEYIKIVSNFVRFGPDLFDGYRIFAKVCGPTGITPEKLPAVSDREMEQLRAIACDLNGSDQISADHIRQVIRRSLARWAGQRQ